MKHLLPMLRLRLGFAFLTLFVPLHCATVSNAQEKSQATHKLAIYLASTNSSGTNWLEWSLERSPLLSDKDIVVYDTNYHRFRVSDQAAKRATEVVSNYFSDPHRLGLDFVMVASGERVYPGVITHCSDHVLLFVSSPELVQGPDPHSFSILAPRSGGYDPRYDMRIMEELHSLFGQSTNAVKK